MADPITDILFRGRFDDAGLSLRADTTDVDGTTLTGHFSRYDTWYPIDSWIEGRFMERVVKGTFRKTMRENRDSIKVAFDHGYDPTIGDKPLGPIEDLREEDEGPFYGVPLLDTDYNRDFILPALRGQTMDGRRFGSLLGASMRFRITRDEWVMEPKKSDSNPDGWPERTIREARLYEFGPVVYPANPGATAGVRSLTDWYHERHRERAERSGRNPSPSTAGLATVDENPAAPPAPGHPEVDPTRTAAALAARTARLRSDAA